jgi:predicted methyltransferase
MGPLLTEQVNEALDTARRAGVATVECSLDLDRTTVLVQLAADRWAYDGRSYPYLEKCKARTVYYWDGAAFAPVARYTTSLIKLVPTQWGAPTFEIDGIKMLPSETVSPYADAIRKVGLVQPRGKVILDTCGGLGYFATCCLDAKAARVLSFEKNPDVLWLRTLNPWSPQPGSANDAVLEVTLADITAAITTLPDRSVDAILHDPPRFGIAGELYSQAFYDQLARVIGRRGKLFHYTGTPNRITSGRNVPEEVSTRLRRAGFGTELNGDGVLATRR